MAFIGQPIPSSTALAGAAYDEDKQLLFVTFVKGQTYLYTGVSQEEVQDLIDASSAGHEFYYGIREDHTGYKMF